MPKHSKQKSGGPKQQRAKAKPYQSTAFAKAAPAKRSALKQAPTLKHKQTAATVAKALGHCGIDSLLADTAAELQEKGIKLTSRSKANKGQEPEQQQQQQQQQQQHSTHLQEQQRQQQQQLAQQQQPNVAAPAQPDLMSMLGSWSVKQPGEEQQPAAV